MQKFNFFPAEKKARFFGRVLKEADRMCFNWSGSGFSFNFTGTSAAAYFFTSDFDGKVPQPDNMAYIGVFVDNMPYQSARFPLDKVKGLYTLAENLPCGRHNIRVVKQTEVGNGTAAVSEIGIDGDDIVPDNAGKLKIEFIGDSITCGYGNICSTASPEFRTHEENFSMTFAAMTAQKLGAELSCVAASGNGLFHDYGCNTNNLIPELYGYTDKMHNNTEKWDFAEDKANVVVIKLGQNDGQFCAGADLKPEERTKKTLEKRRAEFQEKTVDFLAQVKALHPGTPIICIFETDMLLRTEMADAISATDCAYAFEILPKREYEGVGANGHWSVSTHARVAHLLAERIKEVLCLP